MAAIPMIVHVGVASQALPLVAILATRGRRPPAPYRQIALLCCFFLLSDSIMLFIRAMAGYNLWVSWFMQPIEVGCTLWILSAWQPTAKLKSIYLLAIPISAALTAILLVLTDPVATFDLYIGPLLSLLALAGALHTLVNLSLLSRDLLTQQEWFWVCGGLALFWVAYVPVDTFIAAVWGANDDLARIASHVRTSLLPVPFLLITWGVLCQRLRQVSPGHFSAPV